MIVLQVIDQSGADGPYRMTGQSVLRLADDVKVQRTHTGLALIESGRRHLFNLQGEYIGEGF